MWSSKQRVTALAVWFLLLSLTVAPISCQRARKEQTVDQPKDPVIARVNGRDVRRSTFETFMRLKEVELQDHLVPIPE